MENNQPSKCKCYCHIQTSKWQINNDISGVLSAPYCLTAPMCICTSNEYYHITILKLTLSNGVSGMCGVSSFLTEPMYIRICKHYCHIQINDWNTSNGISGVFGVSYVLTICVYVCVNVIVIISLVHETYPMQSVACLVYHTCWLRSYVYQCM